MMKKFRVLSSLLLCCLAIMTVSSVRVSGQEQNTHKLDEVTGITTVSAQKESFERSGYAHVRKLGFGGKKLIMHEETSTMNSNKDGKEEDGTRSGASKISGNKEDGDLKKSFRSLEEQKHDHQIMSSKAHLKTTNHVIPRSGPKSSSYEQQISEEIAKLMNRDYKGRPSHKPPINNHVPRN